MDTIGKGEREKELPKIALLVICRHRKVIFHRNGFVNCSIELKKVPGLYAFSSLFFFCAKSRHPDNIYTTDFMHVNECDELKNSIEFI